jgi:UDPglucose--hexose-1-phosphate uridylyltransferase
MEAPYLRKDPVTQRWVIIAPDRADLADRPVLRSVEAIPPKLCPFCPGHEAQTGTEIHADRYAGTAPDAPGWSVRVVADKLPILRIEGQLGRNAEGMYDSMNAIGAHEILIETADHGQHWAELDLLQMERILRAVQQRSADLRNDPRFRQVLWAKHHGWVTSPFQHPHSHVVATPVVPRAIEEELKGVAEYGRWKERCVFCDMLRQELQEGRRIVQREEGVVAFAPFAARFPYETWVVPVSHAHDYGSTPAATLRLLAHTLQGTVRRLRAVLNDPPYALVLHSSPLGEFAREEYHWHLELVPHPFQTLGLEWGTGIYINPVPPEQGAARLRAVEE